MKRRTLLKLAAAGTVSAALPAFGRKIKPLKILILGGTRFIGLHMTALALERGHKLTFFNRGKTHTDRYPEIEDVNTYCRTFGASNSAVSRTCRGT